MSPVIAGIKSGEMQSLPLKGARPHHKSSEPASCSSRGPAAGTVPFVKVRGASEGPIAKFDLSL
eukprot:gene30095-35060_t